MDAEEQRIEKGEDRELSQKNIAQRLSQRFG